MIRSLRRSIARSVDSTFHRVALSRGRIYRMFSEAERLRPGERREALELLIERYEASRDALFEGPGELSTPRRIARPRRASADVVDLEWQSAYPLFADELHGRLTRHASNRTGHARWLSRGPNRPLVVLIHGYLGGSYPLEERAWPVRDLLGWGLDVALFVLPFHGPRAVGRPIFPASDPRVTIELLRQTVFDLRTLVASARAWGAPAVGVMGMSLGAYVAALAATLEPGLAFVVPMIPLASFADFARDDGRFVGSATERAEQHALLERLYGVASPLGRPPAVAPDRVLVLAAEDDRITPRAHAEKLARHFSARTFTFEGSHLVQLGRARAFDEVRALLRGLGVLP